MPVLVLAPAAVVIAAVMALLLALGAKQISASIANMLPDWSLPGFGSLRSFVSNAANGLYAFVLQQFSEGLTVIRTLIAIPVSFVTGYVNSLISLADEAYNTLYYLVKINIPLNVRNLVARIATYYNLAKAWADQRVNQAIAYLTGVIASQIHTLTLYAESLYVRAVAYALALYRESIAYADEVYNRAIAGANVLAHEAAVYAQTLYVRAEADIQLARQFAQDIALSTAIHAVGVLSTDVVREFAPVWVGVTDEVKGVIATAEGGFTDVISELQTASRVNVGSLAGTVAGAAAITIPMLRLMRDCVIPNCRNLSQFGKDWQELLSVVEDGALLAFIGAAITDPSGIADALLSDLVPVLRQAETDFMAMLP